MVLFKYFADDRLTIGTGSELVAVYSVVVFVVKLLMNYLHAWLEDRK